MSAGVRRNQAGRPSSVTWTTQVPIHQHRHDAVVGEAPPDLQACIERLAYLDGVDAQAITNLPSHAVHIGARLGHGDDRQRQVQHAAHEHAADLPVAVVTGHEDRAAALGEHLVEPGQILRRRIEQRRRALFVE
jgi:hypothetical protein